jgi:hypothetical protein
VADREDQGAEAGTPIATGLRRGGFDGFALRQKHPGSRQNERDLMQ